MIELLVATRNRHKVDEIQSILGPAFRCHALSEFADAPEVVEDGATFAENAARKSGQVASWLAGHSRPGGASAGRWFVLADDSGLEVDALGGRPGVHSARFSRLDDGGGGNAPDADNNAKLLRLLAGVPERERTARFRCLLALTAVEPGSGRPPTDPPLLFEGACEGSIGSAARGEGGFGYDPLFFPTGESQTFAELGAETKNRISHRAQALAGLRNHLARLSSAG